MNDALHHEGNWFAQNKLNLNPSKTRYMIFNGKNTLETNLVKLGNTCFERYGLKATKKLSN